MADGPRYHVKFKRRREGRTNYKRRLELVKSGKPRLVARTRSRTAIAQITLFDPNGDKCVVTSSSTELRKFGYKGNTGNVPAAYLTGLLCALKAKQKGISEAVFDLGNQKKSRRLFAILKGSVDAGLNIPHGEIKVPEEMILGTHIASWASKAKDPIFSLVKKNGLNPESMEEHIKTVKEQITKELSK